MKNMSVRSYRITNVETHPVFFVRQHGVQRALVQHEVEGPVVVRQVARVSDDVLDGRASRRLVFLLLFQRPHYDHAVVASHDPVEEVFEVVRGLGRSVVVILLRRACVVVVLLLLLLLLWLL